MKDIKSMSKEQYIAWRAEKVDMDVETVAKMWEEFESEAKEIGLTDTDTFVKKRFSQAFIKKDKGFGKSPTVEVEVILIGMKESDYGAANQIKEVLKIITNEDGTLKEKSVLEEARNQGYINENIEPLFHYENSKNRKNGTVIDLKKETQCEFTVVGKRLDKPDEFTKGTLSIAKHKLSGMPEFGTVYKTELTVSSKSDKDKIILFGDDRTVFKNGTILKQEQMDSLISNFFGNIMFSMSDLKDVAVNYPDPNVEKYDKYVIVKACVADVNLTREGIGNKLLLTDGFDEDAFCDTWVPENFNINFNTNAQDIWVYGVIGFDERNSMPVINVYGLYVPEVYRLKEQPKPISPETVETVETPSVEEKKEEVTPSVKPQTGGFTF